ncbi:hypothetical protein BB560_005643, partial [Smittium megazygosporum]
MNTKIEYINSSEIRKHVEINRKSPRLNAASISQTRVPTRIYNENRERVLHDLALEYINSFSNDSSAIINSTGKLNGHEVNSLNNFKMGQKESLLSISVGSKASKDNRKDESKEVVQSREAENPINGKKSKSIIKAAIGFAKSLNSASTVFTEKKGSTKNWIRKPSSKSNLTRVRSGSSLVLSTYNNCSRDLFKNNSSDNLLLRRNDTNSAYQTKYVVPLKQQKNSLGANNVMNASLQTQEKIGQATLINVRKSSKINLDYNKFQGASPKIVHQTLDQETDSRK